MNLSNPDSVFLLPGSGHERLEQTAEHRAHVVAAIEAELHLGQVRVAVIRELHRAVGARQGSLDIADQGVDDLELLVQHAGLAAAGDLTVIDSAHGRCHGEAPQPIGHHGQRHSHSRGEEGLDRVVGEGASSQAGQVGAAVLGGLNRDDGGGLVLRAAPPLAATSLPAQVCVVYFDAARELAIGLGEAHASQELILDEPGGAVAHLALAGQLQGRDIAFGLGEQLHRQEPRSQRQLGGLEDRAADDAAVVLAAAALPVQPVFAPEAGTGLHNAPRPADETAGPAGANNHLLALLLGAVELKELRHRQILLELGSVHWHGASPGGIHLSSCLTGSQSELAEVGR
jgi:hypothetical protein